MKSLFWLLPTALFVAVPLLAEQPAKVERTLKPTLRIRVETFKGSGVWDEATLKKEFLGSDTAIILCDVWDKHWCHSATERCGELAKQMVPLLTDLRAKGVTVIHAPSDTMDFYKDAPQRKKMQALTKVEPPKPLGGAHQRLGRSARPSLRS